jgi:hypothetical protein
MEKLKGTSITVIFYPFREKPPASRSPPISVLGVFGAT